MAAPQVTQAVARYTGAGGLERCNRCRFFAAPRRCKRVTGDISPVGWCKYFSRELAWMWRDDGGGDAAIAAAGPSLDLNFTTMSTLDPSITFTRASIGTYYNAAGVMQTAAANVARFDYDPVAHTPRGLLIEESRTNVCTASVPVAATWANTNAPLTPNAATAPDGTATATLMVDNATNAIHVTQTTGTFAYVSGTSYPFSIYVKAATQYVVQIYTAGAPFTNSPYANFDVSAGVVLANVNCTASMQNCGNGWWRCTAVLTSNASASGIQFLVALINNNPSAVRGTTYIGTGTGVYLWGAQTETGAFPTSYIPTSGAAATRAADVATLASLPGRNAAAESFAANFLILTGQEANPRVLGGSASSRAPLFFNATRNGGAFDTVGTLVSANTFTAGNVTKLASNWTVGVANVCLNAGVVASSAALTTGFSGDTTVKLMGDSAAADTCNGYIQRFRYWPRVLSSAELQQVTT